MLDQNDLTLLEQFIKPQLQAILDRVEQVDQKLNATRIALTQALDLATQGSPDREKIAMGIIGVLEMPAIRYEGPDAISQPYGLKYEEAALEMAKSLRAQFGFQQI